MSKEAPSDSVPLWTADGPPVSAKKSHRVQVNEPPCQQTEDTHRDKKEVKHVPKPSDCSGHRVGILKGLTPYERSYTERDEALLHLVATYLYSILKPPTKWTPESFIEIVQLESTVTATELQSVLPIVWKGKTYNIHLTNSLMKGRFGHQSEGRRPGIHQALGRIKRGKAAIWKCDSRYFLLRRLLTGYYFYTMCLADGVPALLFFGCTETLVSFVQETYGYSECTRFLLSNIILHSVEQDDVKRIVWKMKQTTGMQLISPSVALLDGNIHLLQPNLERSLEVGLNVIELKERRPRPSSWDNRLLNACFKREQHTWKVAQAVAPWMTKTLPEPRFSGEQYHLYRWSPALGHRQRRQFEEMINYLLPSWTAQLIVALDCCFVLWSRDAFIYWFSPHRYSSLQETSERLKHRAGFLHMSNALPVASHSLFEYLFELGIFPDHQIEIVSLRVELQSPLTGDSPRSSLDEDQEQLQIPAALDSEPAINLYQPALHSASQLRLVRQVFETIYRNTEHRCD
ncbi:hypothetical protein AND_001934 [Anopheles darlingi]|uniref:Uncharacterized protein n=1 Tax=Anopheles darlingi TaxID=43151 RepID=W5JU60_ANODA|nr:hypothetical protein AND_001934 [Anopheles darlingi]